MWYQAIRGFQKTNYATNEITKFFHMPIFQVSDWILCPGFSQNIEHTILKTKSKQIRAKSHISGFCFTKTLPTLALKASELKPSIQANM